MKRLILVFFLAASPLAHPDEAGYEYTYMELSANHSEDYGYKGVVSVNIPALPFYIRAVTLKDNIKAQGSPYKKSTEALFFGVHASITEILNGISKSGLSFNFDSFMDAYAEIGASRWELKDSLAMVDDGNDAYLRAGIKMGDPTSWEYDLYIEQTKLAKLLIDPVTNKSIYSFSTETNNNIGIKVTTHLRNNFATNFGYNNDNFSGSMLSVGARLSF